MELLLGRAVRFPYLLDSHLRHAVHHHRHHGGHFQTNSSLMFHESSHLDEIIMRNPKQSTALTQYLYYQRSHHRLCRRIFHHSHPPWWEEKQPIILIMNKKSQRARSQRYSSQPSCTSCKRKYSSLLWLGVVFDEVQSLKKSNGGKPRWTFQAFARTNSRYKVRRKALIKRIQNSKALYFIPETEEQTRLRFQTELEFVQCLANPHYLNCKSVRIVL